MQLGHPVCIRGHIIKYANRREICKGHNRIVCLECERLWGMAKRITRGQPIDFNLEWMFNPEKTDVGYTVIKRFPF